MLSHGMPPVRGCDLETRRNVKTEWYKAEL